MLISEINDWQWMITWDNPLPADSSALISALRRLGNVKLTLTKTTCVLAPRSTVSVRRIRMAIEANLHKRIGNATYANLRTRKIWEFGRRTKGKWRRVH